MTPWRDRALTRTGSGNRLAGKEAKALLGPKDSQRGIIDSLTERLEIGIRHRRRRIRRGREIGITGHASEPGKVLEGHGDARLAHTGEKGDTVAARCRRVMTVLTL